MTIDQKYNGTIIGAIFTFVSFLLTFTFVVPMLSVLPVAFVEFFVSMFVGNDPYSNVGWVSVVALILILVISVLLILKISRKKVMNNGHIISFMLVEYIVFHVLGFYIYWGVSHNFRGDGQLLFAAFKSFPYSSLGFVVLGLIIDFFKMSESEKLKKPKGF